MMPGIDSGTVIVQERLERPAAEIRRGFEQRQVDASPGSVYSGRIMNGRYE